MAPLARLPLSPHRVTPDSSTASLPLPPLAHVASQLATILPEIAEVVPAIPQVLAQLAPVVANVREILLDLVGPLGGAVPGELPAVLPELAVVSPELPSVLSELAHVFPHFWTLGPHGGKAQRYYGTGPRHDRQRLHRVPPVNELKFTRLNLMRKTTRCLPLFTDGSAKIAAGTGVSGRPGGIGTVAAEGQRRGQIASSVPVMWPDASRASTAIPSATASTGTQPFRSLSGIAARFASVSMVLGNTAFTVMP
jgi:hypothetical protein